MNYEFVKYNLQNLRPEQVIDYLRKSRSDDPSLSVEEVLQKHESILDEWAERNLGDRVPEENKYREVVSGETIDDRPRIQEVLRKIENPAIKAILVVEVQRLSRGDLEDAGRLIKLLRYTNTYIITPQKIYDLNDEYDRESFERELKRGNEYLEYQKKIMNRGRLLSVSQGNYIGSIPPYGFDKIWVMDGKRKCPTLSENTEQADVVRMIFDMYVNQNMGNVLICNKLDELCIKPPKGKYWSPAGLKDMLQNVHYIGKVKWNWRKTKTIVEDSEIIKTRPKSKIGDYLIYEGRHDGIVPEDLFMAAQAKQGRNHRAKPTTKIRNPLASLLYCQCGRAMSLRTYKKDDRERCAPRLLCDGQTHCKTTSCLYEEMITYVCDILKQCINDFEVKAANTATENSARLHAQLIRNLEKKYQELEAKELAQWEAQADPNPANRMPQSIFQTLNAKLLKEKEEVQQALKKAYEVMPEPVNYIEKITTFQEVLNALSSPDVDATKKNKLLKEVIERIDYYREPSLRVSKSTCEQYGINMEDIKARGNWYTPPFRANVKLRL